MNRLQACCSLAAITLLAGVQYAVIRQVPEEVSQFAFLFLTNFMGFLICLMVLGRELYRADIRQVLASMGLAVLLLGFNLFLLLGGSHLDPTVSSFTVTAYIVFVPILLLLCRKKVAKCQLAGMLLVLLGLGLSMGVKAEGFFNRYILYLFAADLFFASYIVAVEQITGNMNPAVLVLGELFFGSLFALAGWMIQSFCFTGFAPFPRDLSFWSSAFFMAFFIRGLYGIVQIYAQRFVGAIEVSLIFSLEIVFTMVLSPLLALLFGGSAEQITVHKVLGCILLLGGVLVADGTIGQIPAGRKKGKQVSV